MKEYQFEIMRRELNFTLDDMATNITRLDDLALTSEDRDLARKFLEVQGRVLVETAGRIKRYCDGLKAESLEAERKRIVEEWGFLLKQKIPTEQRPKVFIACFACGRVEEIQPEGALTSEAINMHILMKGWLITPRGYYCKQCHEESTNALVDAVLEHTGGLVESDIEENK